MLFALVVVVYTRIDPAHLFFELPGNFPRVSIVCGAPGRRAGMSSIVRRVHFKCTVSSSRSVAGIARKKLSSSQLERCADEVRCLSKLNFEL